MDDEAPFLASLIEGLSLYAQNVNFITADNGKKAMEMLRTISVDMVITDIKMPVKDGFELLEFMGRQHPKTPVIVMSMLDESEVRSRLAGRGVLTRFEFLEKPLDFRTVMNRILSVQ